MRLKDKIAIITGSGSGIGKKIAETFAKEGAKVVIADIDLQQAEKTAKEISQDALALKMDVTHEEEVDNGVAKVIKHFGGVDILVSNAGTQFISPIVDLSLKDWKKLLSIHLDGAFLTTKACLKNMYQRGKGGSIIYMGSVHSKEASKLKAPYVTAKHGLIGLCEVVAKEGAEHNVRANVICPGYVRTHLVDKQIPEQAKKLHITEEEVIKNVFLKDTVDTQFTTTEDVAEVALFFAAFPSNALTGQSQVVSHGWFMQ
jgi:3-hydroxybutyrate dehydrogenase